MLVILYGQTGAGKDYIARKLLGSLGVDAYLAKRPTTRPKRSDKEESYYQFLTDEAFQRGVEKKEILFPKVFNNWNYGVYFGITAQARDKESIYLMTCEKETAFEVADWVGKSEDTNVMLIEIVADEKIRMERAKGRQKNPDVNEIKRRIEADKKDYAEIDRKPDTYYFSDTPFVWMALSALQDKIMEKLKENN